MCATLGTLSGHFTVCAIICLTRLLVKGREQLQARVLPPPENKHWTRPKVSARSAKRRQVSMSRNTTLLFPGFVDEMSNKLCCNSTIAAWVFFFSETAKFSNDWLSWLLAKLKAHRMQLASGSTCFNVDHVSAHPKFMWCYVTIGCDYGFCMVLLHIATHGFSTSIFGSHTSKAWGSKLASPETRPRIPASPQTAIMNATVLLESKACKA